jgi:hypothetical protein
MTENDVNSNASFSNVNDASLGDPDSCGNNIRTDGSHLLQQKLQQKLRLGLSLSLPKSGGIGGRA